MPARKWEPRAHLCVLQDEACKEWVFQGNKTIDKFCEWLFMTEHAGCTVMATTSKAMTVILFCNIYANRASGRCDHAWCKSPEFKSGII